MATPKYTQFTLKRLKNTGYLAAITEHFNVHVRRAGGGFGIRQDLFGFIDILALRGTEPVLAVQSTSAKQMSPHLKKIREDRRENAVAWLKAGGRIELWGWKKLKNRWTPKIREITLDDFLGI